jgi:hypothetical protein
MDHGPPWIPIWGFISPPEPPEGYRLEVEAECFLGIPTAYRFVPYDIDKIAQVAVEGRRG